MEGVTLRDVSRAMNATGQDVPDIPLTGVSIDSRTVEEGQLFFAIRGERFDGHEFVGSALGRGAAAAVVSDRGAAAVAGDSTAARGGAPVLRVGNTVRALQDLASWYRGRFDLRVVGVTGTNGKTTTKDMAAAVLSTTLMTAKTEGNLNNHIGVPLTLLKLEREHEVAVVEMGMSNPGEIQRLAAIARPEIGVITNIAEGHLQSMETIDAVADAKGELLEALPEEGTAILNADDWRVMAQAARTSASVKTFGFGEEADVRALTVGPGEIGERVTGRATRWNVTFELEGDGVVELPLPGRHNVANALAALAVGDVLGVEREDALRGLRAFEPSPMRMLVSRVGAWTVLNDAYNSNPGSLAAALDALMALAAGRPSVAILGDMLELGPRSKNAHREAGSGAAEKGVDYLLLFGSEVESLRAGALEGGMPLERVMVFDDKTVLVRALGELPIREVVMLVKGSRGMRMEEVVELLVKEAPAS